MDRGVLIYVKMPLFIIMSDATNSTLIFCGIIANFILGIITMVKFDSYAEHIIIPL